MVVERRDVWWAELEAPRGSEPGFRRPVLIVQADAFNRSRLRTVIAVVLTTRTRLHAAPGNVHLSSRDARPPKDSVANVSQVVTLDEEFLTERAGRVPQRVMARVDVGLKLVLGL